MFPPYISINVYRLKNGQRAVIDEEGFGVTEDGIGRYWIMYSGFPPLGGALGGDYDAVTKLPFDDAWTQTYSKAVERATGSYSDRIDVLHDEYELYRYVPNQPEGEQQMSEQQDGFKSIDYFNGYPVCEMSDENIFETIGRETAKLDKLSKLPTGAAVDAHKARVQEGIDKLMAAVNARHS